MPRHPKLSIEPKESQIELQILHYLVWVKHLFAWKNQTTGFYDTRRRCFRKQMNPYAINGVPDVLCIVEGRFVGFEVKSLSKAAKQSDSQKEFENRCKKAGGLYFVVRSLRDVEEALASISDSSLKPI